MPRRPVHRWVLMLVACLLVTAYYHSGEKINGVIWSDQEGYYIYLPAVFVHGGFEDVPCINGCITVETPHGKQTFTKYTYGVALLQVPFFLTAHVLTPLLPYPADGRSLPYIWAVMTAAIFYMLAGLALIYHMLQKFPFNATVRLLVPIGLLLGTNLFFYTFREAGMSHVYSFFLFAVLVYSSDARLRQPSSFWSVICGASLVLIVLIRPTNAIAALIPVLWELDRKSFLNRIWGLATDRGLVIGLFTSAAFLFAPQLIYWKRMTGSWLFYSYGNEGFTYWNSPKIIEVLFSPQNGWLVYSPLAVIGLVGIGVMIKNRISGWQLPVSLLTLATYIFASWWAWWFGGAYGHRCYVEYLPVLAVPAAYATMKIRTLPRVWSSVISALAIMAIFVNIRMSDIYHGLWDGPQWGWDDYLEKLLATFYL